MTEVHGLREAYDQLDHEVVECSESLSIPVSTPARFVYPHRPGVTDAEEIADRLADSPIAFLDLSVSNGDAWYAFHVSGSAYDEEHDGDCSVTITTAGVTLVCGHHDLPREAFDRVVEAIADALNVPLRFDPEDEENEHGHD